MYIHASDSPPFRFTSAPTYNISAGPERWIQSAELYSYSVYSAKI